MGNSNRGCPFLKQTEIQIGICMAGSRKRDYRLSTAENGGLKMAKKKAGISEEVREAIIFVLEKHVKQFQTK